jgi:hypothetical protein
MNTMEERERLRESLICSIKDYHFNNPEESRVEVTLEDSSPYVVDLKRIEDEKYFKKAIEEMIDLKLGIKISPVKEEKEEHHDIDIPLLVYKEMKDILVSDDEKLIASTRDKFKKDFNSYMGFMKSNNVFCSYDCIFRGYRRIEKQLHNKIPSITTIINELITEDYITEEPSVYIKALGNTGGIKYKIRIFSLNK